MPLREDILSALYMAFLPAKLDNIWLLKVPLATVVGVILTGGRPIQRLGNVGHVDYDSLYPIPLAFHLEDGGGDIFQTVSQWSHSNSVNTFPLNVPTKMLLMCKTNAQRQRGFTFI